jgi:hypothetical protein
MGVGAILKQSWQQWLMSGFQRDDRGPVYFLCSGS